jgi:mono/diheme cytochrome c family protein
MRPVFAVLALLSVLLAAGCGGQSTVQASPSTVIGPVPKQTTTTPTTPTKHTGNAAAGKAVFASSGCTSCHTLKAAGATGTVGPKLDDLAAMAAKFGKRRGESPAQYVRESILDPTAFTVPGFPKGVMPGTYRKQLSGAQVKALVRYLLSVSGGKGK